MFQFVYNTFFITNRTNYFGTSLCHSIVVNIVKVLSFQRIWRI